MTRPARPVFESPDLGRVLKGFPTMIKLIARLQTLRAIRRDDEGATAVEYGLLVALIAAVIVGVVTTLGTQILAAFQTVVDAL